MNHSHLTGRRQLSAANAGFTLIEVMIVVAIVGILMAIALPSYRAYVIRGDRASARAAMLEAAQFMERFYATNNKFHETNDPTPVAVALPARFQNIPVDSPKYTIGFGNASSPSATALDANHFALEATTIPAGVDAKCGVLWLTHTGVKGTSGTGTVAECWK